MAAPLYEQNMLLREYFEIILIATKDKCHLCLWKYPCFYIPALNNNHCFCRWSVYAFRKLSSQYIQFCQLSMSWVHFWWISVQANLLSIDFNVSWPRSKGFSTSCSYQSWSNFNDATSNNSSTFKTTCSYFIRFNQLIRWF